MFYPSSKLSHVGELCCTTFAYSCYTREWFWVTLLCVVLKLTILHLYVGVYLSQNGRFIEPDSNILITDIGTSSPQQLVCTSDKMPCCQADPQYGEWYFPDESQVIHTSERPAPTTFHRDRDNNGNVNLYRVSSDVMSPTGRFCCEIEDATATNQTVCVNIGVSYAGCVWFTISNSLFPIFFSAFVSVQITGSGATPSLGQSYSLTCSVSGASVTTYQWRKDGSVIQGETTDMLSFSPLGVSDAGQYTCEVTVDGVMYSGEQDITIASKIKICTLVQRRS